ncbi:flagellar basal body-associated FliL family protein [Tabrizicola fusiformis]|uniref:flagellar basal body-associated FliL family protein n=1 Tax=Tabrizicola sp. SY72 TaxID=2741673 RepID=UPI0015718750|nr:flagellar basal body-associated FliL family protein [Tabrizicola sp. SY72]
MAESDSPPEAEPRKSKKPLLIGAGLAVLLGGGGFYATWSGLIPGGGHAEAVAEVADLPDIAFVPVEPLIISLGPGGANRHLRFASQIEANGPHVAEVTLLLPRIIDVMNGYLRALDAKVMEDPAALVRIRSQMLRRIQIVTGEGRVRDLLITEFVLN